MQTQIEKTNAAVVDAVEAAKPVAKKTASKTKPKTATKPAPAKAKTAKQPSKAASATKVKASQAAAYSILPQMRPKAGRALQAHTEAALRALGLYKKGAKIARASLARVIGDTAISYHLKQGSFASPEQGVITLSPMGAEAFKARVAGIDNETLIAEFIALFQTGKAGEAVKAACGKGIDKFIRDAA